MLVRHSLLVILLCVRASVAAAQDSASTAPLTCEVARHRLRAELARAARERPPLGWSAEPASRTSNGQTITRAQRLLYDRSREALQSSVALLDSLSPLHGDLDEATLDEARPRLRARLREIAGELAREDGPRSDVVNAGLDSASVLTARLGLVLCRGGVANAELEGRTIHAYVRIEDVVRTVRRDWISAGLPRLPPVLAAGPPLDAPATATPSASAAVNLAGITDTLDAVTQSLEELQSALDAMSMASTRRDSITTAGPGQTPVSLGELLARVERFATDDAPRWLEAGGGSDALPVLTATSDTLRQVAQAMRIAPAEPGEDDGTSDAQSALERLAQRLDVLYRLLASSTTR
jgi:hypothetical protein